MWLFCDDLKAVFVHTHIAHLLQMCYHSSTHPSHSSICKEELKKSCTITASASRQQSGYEPSPLSQPSVYCWVLCSDECFTCMRTSGMCLYNRVKHTTSEFEVEMLWKYLLCFSILCWPSEASELVSAHKPPTDHHWPSDARVHRFLSVCWTQSLIHKFPNC